MNPWTIYVGFDPREADAYAVARQSIRSRLNVPIAIRGVVLSDLQARGLYRRPTNIKINAEGRPEMVDVLSVRADYDGRISTQHAIARFLVPTIHGQGMALFVDGDILARGNLTELFRIAESDTTKAVWCVKHDYTPADTVKMDGQVQTQYERKNWSSCVLFNCGHPSNRALNPEMVNAVPGRKLHAFYWLDDSEIGEFGPEWNWLVGHSDPAIDPKLVHFTTGTPSMPGYENVPYADEWRLELERWAA
jgi:hypothetical protein